MNTVIMLTEERSVGVNSTCCISMPNGMQFNYRWSKKIYGVPFEKAKFNNSKNNALLYIV